MAIHQAYRFQLCPNGLQARRMLSFAGSCGYEAHADLLAAINIARAGPARIACEVSGAVIPPAAGTRRNDLVLRNVA